jgi:hypothetical protein
MNTIQQWITTWKWAWGEEALIAFVICVVVGVLGNIGSHK